MAERLVSFDFDSLPGGGRTRHGHPWDEWLDGSHGC